MNPASEGLSNENCMVRCRAGRVKVSILACDEIKAEMRKSRKESPGENQMTKRNEAVKKSAVAKQIGRQVVNMGILS
jgi:hypothetical protein